MKPNNALEPFNTRIPFTRETLIPVLAAELGRAQQLEPVIEQTPPDVKSDVAVRD